MSRPSTLRRLRSCPPERCCSRRFARPVDSHRRSVAEGLSHLSSRSVQVGSSPSRRDHSGFQRVRMMGRWYGHSAQFPSIHQPSRRSSDQAFRCGWLAPSGSLTSVVTWHVVPSLGTPSPGDRISQSHPASYVGTLRTPMSVCNPSLGFGFYLGTFGRAVASVASTSSITAPAFSASPVACVVPFVPMFADTQKSIPDRAITVFRSKPAALL